MVFGSDNSKKWNNGISQKEGIRDRLRKQHTVPNSSKTTYRRRAQSKLQIQIAEN